MRRTLAREEHKNLVLVAVVENEMYAVRAYRNGRMISTYQTEDLKEAQEVYSYNLDIMYRH